MHELHAGKLVGKDLQNRLDSTTKVNLVRSLLKTRELPAQKYTKLLKKIVPAFIARVRQIISTRTALNGIT
jgi:hypothetical protein